MMSRGSFMIEPFVSFVSRSPNWRQNSKRCHMEVLFGCLKLVMQHSHDRRGSFSFESVYKTNIIRYVVTSFETLNEKLTIFEMKFLINTFFLSIFRQLNRISSRMKNMEFLSHIKLIRCGRSSNWRQNSKRCHMDYHSENSLFEFTKI